MLRVLALEDRSPSDSIALLAIILLDQLLLSDYFTGTETPKAIVLPKPLYLTSGYEHDLDCQ